MLCRLLPRGGVCLCHCPCDQLLVGDKTLPFPHAQVQHLGFLESPCRLWGDPGQQKV